jgi:hypothetical protein
MRNTFKDIGDQMATATRAAYEYTYAIDAIEDAEANYVSQSAEIRNQIAKLEYTAQDRSKSTEQRKKALQDALALGLEEVKAQKEFTRQKLDAEILFLAQKNKVTEQELLAFVKMTDAERENADQAVKDLYNRNEEKVNSIDQMYATWIDLDTRYYEENKRNLSRLTGFEEEISRDATEKRKKAEELRLDNLKKFIDATAALRQEYEKSVIEGLEGTDRIRAEQEFELRQVQLLEDHLKTLGTLTEEHYKYLDALRESANKKAEVASLQYESDNYNAMVEYGDKVREIERQIQEDALELLEDNEKAKAELKIKFLEEDIQRLKQSTDPLAQLEIQRLQQLIKIFRKEIDDASGGGEGFSIWKLLDPDGKISQDERDSIVDNVKIAVDEVSGLLDDMFSKRVADAQRTRELLDDQIGYTTDALNAEVELAKLGYANNVDAKRKELEELQKQREAAIKKEEKALKAQQAMDSAMQASSLLTASAQIIAGLTKTTPLIGLILAVGAIAAMWATFAAAKVQAAKATKLAEGGTGTDTGVVTGRTHKQGGERFLDHVEVERGEMWGVLSRRASAKYGKQFNQIVTSFNKDQIPVQQMADVNNNILVDVSQTNERLDRVQGELVKLNRHFGTNTEVIETSTARIIKKGNKTRIIRK